MEKAKIYFTRELTPEAMVKLYNALGVQLKGNVAVKLHSGEKGNQNYVRPEFVRSIIDYVHGTVVECNTAYDGARNTTARHRKLIQEHGWSKYFNVDIMDENGSYEVQIPEGKILKKNFLGKNITNYDSMLVLSHFKGHPMGGYGGALKQLSIGCASSAGKAYIHSAGITDGVEKVWDNVPKQDLFLESMVDAAKSVVDLFKGNIVYINIMINMSVDCDCCSIAEDPCLKDIGILISLDPVAIDQACLDLVMKSSDPGVDHFMERVNSRHGTHTIEYAEKLKVGTRDYELISID